MTPEGKVKKRVKEVLTNLGAYYAMPVTGGFGNAGVPDFLVCYQGYFIGIECKSGKGELTALQANNLISIAKAGGHWFRIDEHNVGSLSALIIWSIFRE